MVVLSNDNMQELIVFQAKQIKEVTEERDYYKSLWASMKFGKDDEDEQPI